MNLFNTTVSSANTPHNPVRFANTVGLVVERVRPDDATGMLPVYFIYISLNCTPSSDHLRWYCKSGKHEKPTIIHEDTFHVTNLGTQLKPLIQRWMADPELRTCKECGTTAEAK